MKKLAGNTKALPLAKLKLPQKHGRSELKMYCSVFQYLSGKKKIPQEILLSKHLSEPSEEVRINKGFAFGKTKIATEALKHRIEEWKMYFLCFRASVANKNFRRKF